MLDTVIPQVHFWITSGKAYEVGIWLTEVIVILLSVSFIMKFVFWCKLSANAK